VTSGANAILVHDHGVTRLRMEVLAPAHAPVLLAGLGDPRLYEYIPDDPVLSLTELTARFEHLAAGCQERGEVWRNWVMFAKSDDRVIGTLQASVFANRRATIAYMVLPPYWGQGLAAEGVSWMLCEIAARDHVEWAEAFIDTRNTASLRLVERLGFHRRTTIVAADAFKGSSSDEYVYEKRIV